MTYPFPTQNVPRPGTLAFKEDWSDKTGAGLTIGITNDTPPRLSGPASTWKTFDLPGCQGHGLLGWPNQYLKSSGAALFYDVPLPGCQLTTSRTFPRAGAISLEAVMTASFDPTAFPGNTGCSGILLYDGENGNSSGTDTYVALYIYPVSPTQLVMAFYTSVLPTWTFPVVVAPGTPLVLRIDYVGETNTSLLYLGEQLMFATTRVAFANDPHAALFLSGEGVVGFFNVFTG